MANLEKETVKRVRQALLDAELPDTIQELPQTARSAAEAAAALDVDPGSIVKSLVFTVGNRFVLVLVAGDRQCCEDQLARAFGLEGQVVRPTADLVRAVTGFTIGGVSPVGMVTQLAVVVDASLKRFEKVYPSAGHRHCVFQTTVNELKTLTGGTMSYAIAKEVPAS